MMNAKNVTKRGLSVLVAFLILLGACFTGVITASTEGAFTKATTSNVVAPKKSTESTTNIGTVANSTVDAGNAINLKYNRLASSRPAQYLENLSDGTAFPGEKGLTFRFARYTCAETVKSYDATTHKGFRTFALTFRNSQTAGQASSAIRQGRPFLLFDMVAGTVSLAIGTNNDNPYEYSVAEVIIDDDAVRYENLNAKVFDVVFNNYADDNTKIQVSVIVYNTDSTTTTVTGLMSKDKFFVAEDFAGVSRALKASDTTEYYLTLTCPDDTRSTDQYRINWNIDFYGHKPNDNDFVPPAIVPEDNSAMLAALTEIATVNDACENVDSAFKTWTDLEGGGVRLEYSAGSADMNYEYSKNMGRESNGAFPGTYGLRLQFEKYFRETSNARGNGIIAISLTRAANTGNITVGVPFILIDTKNGMLSLAHGTSLTCGADYKTDEVIILNDLLKYNNIERKEFSVAFTPYDDTYIKVTFDVEGTKVAGLMTKSLLFAQNKGPKSDDYSVYATIGSLDYANNANTESAPHNVWGLTFYGYEILDSSYTSPAPTLAPSLHVVGLTDIAQKADAYNPTTSTAYTWTDLETGGVKLAYKACSADMPYTYNINIGTEAGAFPGTYGFRLQFDGYKNKNTTATPAGDGILAISLTKSLSKAKIKAGTPFLAINTNDGTLKLGHGDGDFNPNAQVAYDATILTSDLLKEDNLTGKPFAIEVSPYMDDYVLVAVDVDGEVVAGIVEKSLFTAQTNAAAANTYISIGSFDNGNAGNTAAKPYNKWEVIFYGYKALDENYEAPTPHNPPASLADGLTDVATLDKKVNADASNYATYTDIARGGVKMSYKAISASMHYTYNQDIGSIIGPFPGKKGFMLQFDGYDNLNDPTNDQIQSNGRFAITLTNNSKNYEIKKKIPFIEVNTIEGTLKLGHGNSDSPALNPVYDETIITDDLLKLENIRLKPFTIEFLPYDETSIKVVVNVDGSKAEGLMTKSLLFAQSLGPKEAGGSMYISIGGFDNVNTPNNGTTNKNYGYKWHNKWQLNFYGYKSYGILDEDTMIKATAAEVTTAIAALGTTASLDKAQDILLAKAKYDALSSAQKQNVVDADKLLQLIKDLNTLRKNNKYKATSTYLADDPTYEGQFPNEYTRTVYSSETANGFKAEWRGTGSSLNNYKQLTSQSIAGAYKLDGLRLFIEDFNFKESKKTDFWIHFTSGAHTEVWNGSDAMSNKMIAIRLGLTDERIEVYGAGTDGGWFAGKTDMLVRDNFVGKSIIIEWLKQTNGDYICTITIGDEVVAFTVSKQKIAMMTAFDEDRVRMTIGTQSIANVFSMVVDGFYANLDTAAKSVINQIDNLPAQIKSDNDAATVEAVYKAYNALTTAQKQQVVNIKELSAKRAAVRKYKGYDEEGRDADGYYVPNITTDVYGDNKKDNVYVEVTESTLGGWHLNFNSGGFGVKNCFTQNYVMDGLSLRFDNLNFGHGSGLIVGFESNTAAAKTYDYSSTVSKYGIFLLIGEGNNVYSSMAGKTHEEFFPLFEDNEKLSAANLLNKEFFINWTVNDNDTITLDFVVDNTTFTYTYSKEYLDVMGPFDPEEFEIVFQAANGFNPSISPVSKANILSSISFDITGISYKPFSKAQMADIEEVIEAIKLLPDNVTLADEEAIVNAWTLYYELDFGFMRKGVTNFARLVTLREKLFDLYESSGLFYAFKVEETEDDNYGYADDYNTSYEENEEETETKKETVRVKKSKKKKTTQTTDNSWIIFVIIAAVIVLAAGATMIILFKRRKSGKGAK